MIALFMTAVATLSLIIVATSDAAGEVVFALETTLIGFGFSLFVGNSLERYIPSSLWDHVSLSRTAARRCGVDLFNTVLNKIGWNRQIIALRGDLATGPFERWDTRPMRSAAVGHGWAFILHIATAMWTGMKEGAWTISLILFLVGTIGHLLPVLLQIRILTRWREKQERF